MSNYIYIITAKDDETKACVVCAELFGQEVKQDRHNT